MGIFNKKQVLKKLHTGGIVALIIGGAVFTFSAAKTAEYDSVKATHQNDLDTIAQIYTQNYGTSEDNDYIFTQKELGNLKNNNQVSENIKEYIQKKQDALEESKKKSNQSTMGILIGLLTSTLGISTIGTIELQQANSKDNKKDELEK